MSAVEELQFRALGLRRVVAFELECPSKPNSRTLTAARELEMELDGKKITQFRTTASIYFDVEH